MILSLILLFHHTQEFKCAVVSEEQLASYKASLAVVNCVHIYSIHRCKLKVGSTWRYISTRTQILHDPAVRNFETGGL